MTNVAAIPASTDKLNRFFAFVIIPMLGIALPNVAGLISNDRYDGWQLLVSYAYFVCVALLIWKGNLAFFKSIRKRYETRSTRYYRMLLSYILVTVLYSALIS